MEALDEMHAGREHSVAVLFPSQDGRLRRDVSAGLPAMSGQNGRAGGQEGVTHKVFFPQDGACAQPYKYSKKFKLPSAPRNGDVAEQKSSENAPLTSPSASNTSKT